MIGVHRCFQEERGDVGEVCALRLLVHRALVQLGVLRPCVVHCIDVHHWEWNKEDFVGRFCKSAVLAIPACSFKEESVHVDTFLRRGSDILLELACCVVVQHHPVQSPALVGSRHLLHSNGVDRSLAQPSRCVSVPTHAQLACYVCHYMERRPESGLHMPAGLGGTAKLGQATSDCIRLHQSLLLMSSLGCSGTIYIQLSHVSAIDGGII